jgi:hypothetical protein
MADQEDFAAIPGLGPVKALQPLLTPLQILLWFITCAVCTVSAGVMLSVLPAGSAAWQKQCTVPHQACFVGTFYCLQE